MHTIQVFCWSQTTGPLVILTPDIIHIVMVTCDRVYCSILTGTYQRHLFGTFVSLSVVMRFDSLHVTFCDNNKK